MAAKGVGEGEVVTLRGVELDGVVAGDGQSGVVLREGMVADGRVEEVVDAGRGHVCGLGWFDRRGGVSTVN